MKIVDYISLPTIKTSAIPGSPGLGRILQAVCDENDVSIFDVKGDRRNLELVTARREYSYLARKLTNKSLEVIGAEINRDHSSVLHHIRKVDNWWKIYNLAHKFEQIENRL